jgi:hypothetical protein
MTGREMMVRVLDIMVMVAIISLSLILGFGLKYPWWATGGLVVALFIAWVLARIIWRRLT